EASFPLTFRRIPDSRGNPGALTWPEWQNQSGRDGIFRRSSVAGTQIRASRRFYSPAFLPCRGAMWLREGRSWSAALVCQCFAGCPAFAGKIVDDTVSAPDAWSLTLGHSNRVARNGAEVLARVGVTPFL